MVKGFSMGRKNNNISNTGVLENAERKSTIGTLKRVFIDSCVCYTILVFLLSLIVSLLNNTMVIVVTDFVWLYAFSLLIALANLILRYKPLAMGIRVVLHMVTIFSGFAVYIVLVKQNDASSVAFLSIPFIAVYALVMLGVLVVNSLFKKNERENKSEYKSIYTNANNK